MIRERLVGTWLGFAILSVKEKAQLFKAALLYPESVGTVYNDHLVLHLAVELCDPHGTFVDVGAHIGSVSAAVLRRHPSARVIAIEPIPEKVAHLRRRFPSIIVYGCAIAEMRGCAPFFVNTTESGCSSLLGAANAKQINVDLRPLDELLVNEAVSLIKIDVEGSELGVLLGASAVTARSRPIIVFESALDEDGGKAQIWQWFNKREYAVCIPNRVSHYDDGMSLECFLDSHRYPRYTMNYVAIPRERRLEARVRARTYMGWPVE